MIEYRKKCCLLIFEEESDRNTYLELASRESVSKAEELYYNNLKRTAQALQELPFASAVWVREKGTTSAIWGNAKQEVMQGDSQSEKIAFAFNKAFEQGFRKVILLKADCPAISTAILEEAFLALKIIEFSIGLNDRGGYYQLGMNQFEPEILRHADWTAPDIGKKIIRSIGDLKMALYKTKMLSVIDKVQ